MTPASGGARPSRRWACVLLAPALAILVLFGFVPLAATVIESLFRHPLAMPWLGRPFVGLANFRAALADARVRDAIVHTAAFAALTVPLELALGVCLALLVDRPFRGRRAARAVMLLPWAIPTVVVGLIARALVEQPASPLDLATRTGAWTAIVLADVWKTTPFVALLVLAGLQTIDPELHRAARLDGASAFERFREITLPLLRRTLVVAAVFRTLDAIRVFDLVYVLTDGGPGTATEPLALLAFRSLLRDLRFGYGSALSVLLFAGAMLAALAVVRIGNPRDGIALRGSR